MSFGRLARTLALLLLGAMLFVRMGPMCEAIAQAAPPAEAHAGMADCDRAPPTPVKKAPSVDCVGACIATVLDVHTYPAPQLAVRTNLPAPEPHALVGRSGGPAPPPPRTA